MKQIIIADLKKEIPYQWRIQSFSKNKASASCVAYIDARDAMELLDEVCGPENWKDEYYQVKNTVFCKVSIRLEGEWVSKCDCGDETDVEAKKGESSDAFKRACVKWGLGRFLYAIPIQYVDTNKPLSQNKTDPKPFPIDSSKQRIWNLTEHINKKLNKTNKHAEDTDFKSDTGIINVDAPGCSKCGSVNQKHNETGQYGPYWHCNDCGKNDSVK